jgi:sialic acid synthase SpsE/quercetin dioxygenase-like cupin family protein
MSKFDFNNLIVLDLANNHQGQVSHAKLIIDSCSSITSDLSLRASIKFQFRDLPTFVHRSHRSHSSNKHVDRFMSTMLSWNDFQQLKDYSASKNLLTICTPFDEKSVEKIVSMGFDLIKVASCSARDWPLLERISQADLPVIISTGGLLQSEVDDIVSFFQHRACDFALMHCVSVYPTPDNLCNIANIVHFRERYPDITIGWSTHENPDDLLHLPLAYGSGARIFERHVGLPTEIFKLNNYSSNPSQLYQWLSVFQRTLIVYGSYERPTPSETELASIQSLKRGVFASQFLEAGTPLDTSNIYFAFPAIEGQLSSADLSCSPILSIDISPESPILLRDCNLKPHDDIAILKAAIHDVKALLSYAHIKLSSNFTTEYSHHYGISNFRETGAVLITVVNREYAKKLIVQLSGQSHPLHYHQLKEETFHVLWGSLYSELDGKVSFLSPGDTVTVLPGVWHRFWTETGCIFEEISTTAVQNDSIYKDPRINNLRPSERKTSVDHWGRFQIDQALSRN